MNKPISILNRVIFKKEQQKSKALLLKKIRCMKYSNLSALNKSKSRASEIGKSPIHQLEDLKQENIKMLKGISEVSDGVMKQQQQSHYYSKRTKQEDKIRSQNRAFLKKLKQQKSTISNKKLKLDWARNEEAIKVRSKYQQGPRSRTTQLDCYSDKQMCKSLEKENGRKSSCQEQPTRRKTTISNITKNTEIKTFKKRKLSHLSNLEHSSSVGKIQESIIQRNIFLWEKNILINSTEFHLKIIRQKNSYLIALTEITQNQSNQQQKVNKIGHYLELSEEEGMRLFSEYDYDYPYICNFFKIGPNFEIYLCQKRMKIKFNKQGIKSKTQLQQIPQEIISKM